MSAVRLFLTFLLGILSSEAATVTVTNFNGPSSRLLTQEDGTLFANGLVWVGTFEIDSEAIRQAGADQDYLLLETQFRQFGRATAVNFDGLPGLYQDAVTQTVVDGDAFANQQVYTVVSNMGRLRDATELLIFEHDQVFLPDPSRNDPALLSEDEGTVLIGEFGRHRGTVGQVVDQPTFTLARRLVIPEPHTASLLISGLGLALFRRSRTLSSTFL